MLWWIFPGLHLQIRSIVAWSVSLRFLFFFTFLLPKMTDGADVRVQKMNWKIWWWQSKMANKNKNENFQIFFFFLIFHSPFAFVFHVCFICSNKTKKKPKTNTKRRDTMILIAISLKFVTYLCIWSVVFMAHSPPIDARVCVCLCMTWKQVFC